MNSQIPLIPPHLALTGRVATWINEVLRQGVSIYRLPVSCTTFTVEDRFDGEDGIIDSWKFTALALKQAAGVAVNLSKLSPANISRPSGVVPSGPVSFAEMYSKICSTVRRGGRKIGAVNLFLDADHPDAKEFVNAPRSVLPWAKKTLYVDRDPNTYPYANDIIRAINRGDLWLAKKQYDSKGDRLYSNVCLEVLLKHRGTCLLSHTNLGTCPIEGIPRAMAENMNWLCQLHALTGVGESGIYLSSEQDRQVGLGFIGLANLLAHEDITYWELKHALGYLYQKTKFNSKEIQKTWDNLEYLTMPKHLKLALALAAGYHKAAAIARSYNMERAFVIAPTATSSYSHKDKLDYSCTPEISPPLSYCVDRDSQELGVGTYYYPPNVEIASDVGYGCYFELLNLFQLMMNSTGLAHSISANIWVDYDSEWLTKWWNSSLISTYYRLLVNQSALDKTTTGACSLDSQECESCSA